MNRMIILSVCFPVFCTPVLAGTVHVDAATVQPGDGSSWGNAKIDLRDAVSGARSGDEVWVAAGTYGPISLKNGVGIYGGFDGTETAASQADPVANRTVISGGGVQRAVVSIDNESSAVLRGFQIVDGFIDFPDTGGGLYLKNSNATIVRCVFTGNKSVAMGGAVANWGGSPTFVNCQFHGNDGGWAAGALWNRKSGSPTFVNCLFYDNRASEAGAVSVLTGAPSFINCTFTDNRAVKGKGGAIFDNRGKAVLRNCIVWNNTAAAANTQSIYNNQAMGGTSTVTHSNVKGAWPGAGNVDTAPLFRNASAHDYRLQAGSPCRDSGDNASIPKDLADLDWNGDTAESIPKDLALNPRISDAAVDMGAYE